MTKLKKKFSTAILQDQVLQALIANSTGRNVQSIIRWARTNHQFLTMHSALEALSKYLKTPIDELLEKSENSAK